LEEFRSIAQVATYKPRQVVFTEGSPTAGLYLVCHGMVKLYQSDRFGRDHIVEVAGPGAVLGEFCNEGDAFGISVSAETLVESQLCFLPRERLIRFMEKHPLTAIRLVAALSAQLASARRKVRELALKGAESRLASLLLRFARASGDLSPGRRLQLGYKRSELAEMIGVSTETAIRLLGKLKDRGAIDTVRRDIVITDVEKLQKVANHDEVYV